MADVDHIFQLLCHEAVVACGDDLAAIECYVAARLAAMDSPTKQAVKRDIERVLAFTAPDRSAREN